MKTCKSWTPISIPDSQPWLSFKSGRFLRFGLGLALAAVMAVSSGCGDSNPLAPSGSFLSITASPSRISLNGTATILVTGRRPDGNPLPDGTEIRMSTTLGTIEPIVETDDQGVARATLQADGRAGTATVTATAGGETEATIDVPIGETDASQPQVTVTVNPDNIPVGEESTATVTVVARNQDGTPAPAGLSVVFTSTLGFLDPTQTTTDSDGTATSTITAGLQSGNAEIAAFVGSAPRATTSLTIRDAATALSLQPDPTSISRTDTTVELLAFVTNSQGLPLQGQAVTFLSEVGSFGGDNVAFTDTNGQATSTLSVTQAQLGPDRQSFVVRARTPAGNGQLIEATATIEIR